MIFCIILYYTISYYIIYIYVYSYPSILAANDLAGYLTYIQTFYLFLFVIVSGILSDILIATLSGILTGKGFGSRAWKHARTLATSS